MVSRIVGPVWTMAAHTRRSLLLAIALCGGTALAQTTTRVSLRSDGLQERRDSQAAAISADGRFVAFESLGASLVPGDTNGCSDVFLHDRELSTTIRVSVDSQGREAKGDSRAPAISADGRYVAFESLAENLAGFPHSGSIFVNDRITGETSLVSIDSFGRAADRPCSRPSISADGDVVAFESAAANLVPNDTNGLPDVFVHDRRTCSTIRASINWRRVSARGTSGWPAISGDGRWVAFLSDAETIVVGDTNRVDDVFLFDRESHRTRRISAGWGGGSANGPSFKPSISFDGRYLAFASDAGNLVQHDRGQRDVFVYDRRTAKAQLVSVNSLGVKGNQSSGGPSISADGRWIAFHSSATNLVPGDTNGVDDVFLYDSELFAMSRVSRSTRGEQADSFSYGPSVAGDGSSVAFTSRARNLAGGDTNGAWDVFVFDARPLASPCTAYYADRDGDGFGNPNARVFETAPRAGYVADDSDCEDSDAAVHAGAQERYNGIDDNCDGEIDEGFVGSACRAIPNSLGCDPLLVCRGAASASAAKPFEIEVESLRNHSLGLLVWSRGGPSTLDTLAGPCLSWSRVHSEIMHADGNPLPDADCSGRILFTFDPRAGPLRGWTPASVLYAQYVGRDRGDVPSRGVLVVSNAVWFVIAP